MRHPLATDPSSPFWLGLRDWTASEPTPVWVRITCTIIAVVLFAVVMSDAWQARGRRR